MERLEGKIADKRHQQKPQDIFRYIKQMINERKVVLTLKRAETNVGVLQSTLGRGLGEKVDAADLDSILK